MLGKKKVGGKLDLNLFRGHMRDLKNLHGSLKDLCTDLYA